MNDLRRRKWMALLSLFAAAGLVASMGRAQTATAITAAVAPTNDAPRVLETFVVTGSNIPSAAEALSLPVAVIGSTAMEESGVSGNALEILRKVAPNISGVGDENATIATGSNFGGASVNIKGLPTLVLIDGRRVANDPAESAGGFQFVDLNLIPTAAVERFEILQDGASALYGSDAVGGVINIILKRNYKGWEMGAHYGFSRASGKYEERSGYLVGGVANEKSSVTVSFDYAEHTPLHLSDRPYTNPIYGTHTFPGVIDVFDNKLGTDDYYVLGPGINAPPGGGTSTLEQLVASGTYVPRTAAQVFHTFNVARGETFLQYLKRSSALINMEHKIFGDSLVGFGSVITANTKTWSSLNAQPIVPFVSDPYTDVNVNVGVTPPPPGVTFVPYTAPTNPFSQAYLDQGAPADGSTGKGVYARNRFLAHRRLFQNDSTLYRIVGGLRGDIGGDLHWEGAININRCPLNYTNPGLIDTLPLQAALASGQINPFAINQAPGAFTGVIGTAFVHMLSTLNSCDFKVDGSLFDLPAGKVGFAAGAGYVRENLSATPDVNSLPNATGTTQGWSNATTFEDFSANRTIESGFAEVSVPVTGARQNIAGAHAAHIDGAVRYDAYSGRVGSTTNPEVSLSWEPVDDQFKFRASAGKSFIAPPLFELYGPVSSGSTPSITYTAVGGTSETVQFNQTGGANPLLKPTTAHSWAAGFIFTPKAVPGLSVTVDYSQITEKQIVGTVPANTIAQSVETSGAASPYVGDVHYNTPTGASPTAPGGISNHSPQSIYVIQNLINLGGQKVNSTDINVGYTWKGEGIGAFAVTSAWTWYNSYKLQLIPSEKYYEYAATASVNEAATLPRWRTYTTLDWRNLGADAFIGVTIISGVTDIGTGGTNAYGFEKVASFTSFDAGLSYDFSHLHRNKVLDSLKVTVGCNNVFGMRPPLAINAFPNTNADVGTYDGAIGRLFYVNAMLRF